jgi:hypothetical protein
VPGACPDNACCTLTTAMPVFLPVGPIAVKAARIPQARVHAAGL